MIQANLAAVGIAVQINQHDSGSFWSLGSEADGERWRSLQLILQKYGMQPDPAFATAWFTPEQVGIWNWERFSQRRSSARCTGRRWSRPTRPSATACTGACRT